MTLPPGWRGRWEGDGGDGRDGRGARRGVGEGGVWDDRVGRPTPERFHESRVSKHGPECGN